MSDIPNRTAELRLMLSERQIALQNEVHNRIRDGRTDRLKEVRDDIEHSDAGMQGDIELSLLQMRADMLSRIKEALARLDDGRYGYCFECEGEISDRRLRAMPFAVRCQACEQRREHEQKRERRIAQRRDGGSLFSNPLNT